MNMPAADDDELLSAYLDGELTAEERARVEQLLAKRPESRQLLEDLRTMKIGLERMPRARLGHDFAERVLRQAEKELLTGGDDDRQLGPTTTIDLASRVERSDGISWQRVRRPILWASLTLAAGLLIMFLEGKRPAPLQQVAQAPGMAGERGHGEIGAPAGPATAPAIPQVQVEGEPELGRRSAPEGSAAHSEKKAGTTPRPAEEPPLAAPEAKKPSVEQRTSGSAARHFDPAQAEKAKRDSTVAGGRQTTDLNDAMKREDEAGGEELQQAIYKNQTLVVWCDVAPAADFNETFRELLAKENIHWEEAAVSEAEGLEVDRGEDRPARAKVAGNAPADKTAPEGELPDGAAPLGGVDAKNLALLLSRRANRSDAADLADAEEAVLDPHTEMVLVAASQPQIEAVLAALDHDADVFMSIDVEPAADAPHQRPLERYRRGLSEKLDQRSEKPAGKQQPPAADEAPPKPAPVSTATGDETNENRSPVGVARKLKASTSPLAEAVGKKAESGKATEAGQSGLEVAPQRESKLRLSQRSRPPAAAEGQFGLKTDQVQLQVLFVLRPREATEPSKAAAPAKEKRSSGTDGK